MTPQEKIAQLRLELHRHNHLYYVECQPVISDKEFDELLLQLQQLEKEHPECYDPNSPTSRVGSDLSNAFKTVKHKYPMLSLGNTYNRAELAEFYQRVQEGLDGMPFSISCELKFDGVSISLIYEHGNLVRAVTRGDGVSGDDVTENVRTIRTIPLTLPSHIKYPESFEIRGEVLMPWNVFDKLNEDRARNNEPLFANPRNAAAGTLKNKVSAVASNRRLDAYLYYLLGDEIPKYSHFDNMQRAKSWGFKVSETNKLVNSLEEMYSFIDYWDQARRELPFATDGIVFKVDNIQQQEILGYTAKSPKWAIAYKFQAERACTRLNEVVFQVGRTGAITPVAVMNPVQLSGTVVQRASLHNADIIESFDLHIGDGVFVEKAGEIIPQIVGVDLSMRDNTIGDKVTFPSVCPVCKTPLVRYPDEAVHYCPNDTGCSPQLKGKIEHFVSRDAMNIDAVGPETIEMLFRSNLLPYQDAADLYALRLSDLCAPHSTREKSCKRIIEGIKKSLNTPFDRVLYALGIRFVGKVTAKQLARHFKNIEALKQASFDELMMVEGVGNIICESVINYFSKPENIDFISRLTLAGVQMSLPETDLLSDSLAGKSIVISGTFEKHSREEYKVLIEQHGGKNVSSISKRTSFVLAGIGMGPSKMQKAESLGIPIVNEEDFLKMIEESLNTEL